MKNVSGAERFVVERTGDRIQLFADGARPGGWSPSTQRRRELPTTSAIAVQNGAITFLLAMR
jgi:hypothetical protein